MEEKEPVPLSIHSFVNLESERELVRSRYSSFGLYDPTNLEKIDESPNYTDTGITCPPEVLMLRSAYAEATGTIVGKMSTQDNAVLRAYTASIDKQEQLLMRLAAPAEFAQHTLEPRVAETGEVRIVAHEPVGEVKKTRR